LAQHDTECVSIVWLFQSLLHQASPHTDVIQRHCSMDYELELTGKQSQHDLAAPVMILHLLASAAHLRLSNLQISAFISG